MLCHFYIHQRRVGVQYSFCQNLFNILKEISQKWEKLTPPIQDNIEYRNLLFLSFLSCVKDFRSQLNIIFSLVMYWFEEMDTGVRPYISNFFFSLYPTLFKVTGWLLNLCSAIVFKIRNAVRQSQVLLHQLIYNHFHNRFKPGCRSVCPTKICPRISQCIFMHWHIDKMKSEI